MSRVSSYVFELRFQPSPRMLDMRGQIANLLVDEFFPRWAITQDAVQLSNDTNKHILKIFRHNSFAFIANKQTTNDFFLSESKKMCNKVWELFPHDSILRIGVRSSFYNSTDAFDTAFEGYKNKFLKLSNSDLNLFGGELTDIGMPLNFEEGDNFFNVSSGPMKRQQAKDVIRTEDEDISENGLFVDVDYFCQRKIGKRAIGNFIDEGVRKGEKINSLYLDWIFPQEE